MESLNYENIAEKQKKNTTLLKVKENTSLQHENLPNLFGYSTFLCDMKKCNPRPYITPLLCKKIFNHLHWKHTKSSIVKLQRPDDRFTHLHLDIVGPLPIAHGFTYMLTIMDRFSRWLVAFHILNTSA